MLKDVVIILDKVEYSGDSIGDDIGIDLQIGQKAHNFTRKFKPNTTIKLGHKILTVYSVIDQISVPLLIKVTESDLKFNDIGSVSDDVIYDHTKKTQAQKVVRVVVNETKLKVAKNRSAFFDFFFTIKAVEPIRYIKNMKDGWLVVKVDDAEISIPSFLKVQYEFTKQNREYFKILEGVHKDKIGSVKIDGGPYLLSDFSYYKGASIEYSNRTKTLRVNNQKYITVNYHTEPWPTGIYDILMPDYPHLGGEIYLKVAEKAKVWFRIGKDGEKYIHTGQVSLGCITLVEHNKWDDLCELLMKSRIGDGKNIGMLKVK